MARIDDYKQARQIAVKELSKKKLEDIALKSGFSMQDSNIIVIPFLDRKYSVHYPEFEFKDINDLNKEVPIQEQIILLHYLISAGKIEKKSGKWISYREIPGASFYFEAFVKRAINPLKKRFGDNPATIAEPAGKLFGASIETGDAGYEFYLLPKVPLQLIIWMGDEEFPSEANILFDESIGALLSPEDVAWLSGMLVYRLISIK